MFWPSSCWIGVYDYKHFLSPKTVFFCNCAVVSFSLFLKEHFFHLPKLVKKARVFALRKNVVLWLQTELVSNYAAVAKGMRIFVLSWTRMASSAVKTLRHKSGIFEYSFAGHTMMLWILKNVICTNTCLTSFNIVSRVQLQDAGDVM